MSDLVGNPEDSFSRVVAHIVSMTVLVQVNNAVYMCWYNLPDSLISSAEMSDDCVSKFSFLVRTRN